MKEATYEGTLKFAQKFKDYKQFFIKSNDLVFSKLGLGTFNKEPYKEENYVYHYIAAVKEAIENGVNVIDSASNYRYGESEKEIGIAIKELMDEGKITREELILSSKGGFIQLEYPFPKNPYEWIEENVLKPKLASKNEIELDQHCMSPEFLEFSCKRSLENMQVDKFDIYYLHNPEMQLIRLGYEKFLIEIEKIFKKFEEMVKKGLIKYYGVAVWNAFINPINSKEHINLEDLVKIAQKVGGRNHHFKYVQTPFNLAKTAIYNQMTQKVDGEECTLLQAAHRLKIGVISSSSLLQMNLFKKSFSPEIGYILDKNMNLKDDIQLALQFVRSTPSVVTSLFGSVVPVHIRENLKVASINPTPRSYYDLIYKL